MKPEPMDLGINLDELFMGDKAREELHLPKIHDIPIDEIDDFPNHPFKVRQDEDMCQLVESISERGIITPVTLRRKPDGRYEMISGHRRKAACELAGLKTIKAEIRELDNDEAVLMMVESNLQRSVILPSEKAFAYKMRYEALKRQGKRSDLTSSPVETKLRADEKIAKASSDSRAQVDRYIRLTELIPELLELVDNQAIAFRPAVEISFLTKEEQGWLLNAIRESDATPSLAQAIRMKNMSREKLLTEDGISIIQAEKKANQVEHISIRADKLRKYIPENIPAYKTEEYIIRALEYYMRNAE